MAPQRDHVGIGFLGEKIARELRAVAAVRGAIVDEFEQVGPAAGGHFRVLFAAHRRKILTERIGGEAEQEPWLAGAVEGTAARRGGGCGGLGEGGCDGGCDAGGSGEFEEIAAGYRVHCGHGGGGGKISGRHRRPRL